MLVVDACNRQLIYLRFFFFIFKFNDGFEVARCLMQELKYEKTQPIIRSKYIWAASLIQNLTLNSFFLQILTDKILSRVAYQNSALELWIWYFKVKLLLWNNPHSAQRSALYGNSGIISWSLHVCYYYLGSQGLWVFLQIWKCHSKKDVLLPNVNIRVSWR